MQATKDHVREVEKKYGVVIREERPRKGCNIVQSARKHGQPFMSKIHSKGIEGIQTKGIPLSIHDEYWEAEDKHEKRRELSERYPKSEGTINFLCCCNREGEPRPNIQLVVNSSPYMLDFLKEYPPDFKISAKCCDYCKKDVAHRVQKDYDMVITGERRDEGGMRSVPKQDNTSLCFTETANGQFRLRPLFYVSNKDKAWYKEYYGVRYSDAYEVYGLERTGCCGCPISYRAVDDLEIIRQYEPNVVKAAWNIFGDSYRYRQKYVEYRSKRNAEKKEAKRLAKLMEKEEKKREKLRQKELERLEREQIKGQIRIEDILSEEGGD
jgi:3'-phosphoadenosine 5'-phosphosulfate sulfotransferase (PAPS reductase)/FAD synthetase